MIAAIIGRNARPGLERREAEGLLQVVGEEQEDAEHAGAGDRDGEVGRRRGRGRARRAAAAAGARRGARSRRTRRAARRRRRARRSSAARPSRGSRRWRSRRRGANRPAEAVSVPGRSMRGRLGAAPLADEQRAARPIAAGTAKSRLTYRHQRQSRYSVSDAAEEQADGGAGAGDRAEDAERLGRAPPGSVKVVVSRPSAAGASSAPNAPCSARAATRTPKLWASAAERGGDGEAEQADDEDALAAEEVADAAAEQQQAAERQRVGGDDPLARARRRSRGPPARTAARCSRSSRRARPSAARGR